ncbi:MAG: type II secretion system F family protein [Candidatus Roizmanbacteria bacterium]
MNKNLYDSIFNKVSLQEQLFFTKHVAIMLKSGILLREAVEIVSGHTKSAHFKIVLKKIGDDLENGKPLSKSLQKFPHIFKPIFFHIIEIGEESGTLEQSMEYMSLQLEKEYSLRKSIFNAMMYPLVILGSAVGMGGYISVFILPKLTDFFRNVSGKLPLSTRILLFVTDIFTNHQVTLLFAITFIVLVGGYLSSISIIREKFQLLVLNIPQIGTLICNLEVILFCRNMGIMMKSGISINSALEAQYNATAHPVYKKYVKQMYESVMKGKPLGEELSKKEYKHIPFIMTKMISVGESTGKIEEVLIYLADYFEKEVDDQVKNLSAIIEPVILLSIGIMVGFLGIAIISPIYELTGAIQ